MSEHADVREILEIAAVEPDGLDRLEAGDTPESVAVAGHLAGCPDCLEELARLRRAETLIRPVVAELPDPALRERTLAFVRSVGVTRGPDAMPRLAVVRADATALPDATPRLDAIPHLSDATLRPDATPRQAVAQGPAELRSATETPAVPAPSAARLRRVPTAGWLAAIAAALVVGVLGGSMIAGGGRPGGADTAAAMSAVARQTAALLAAGDARQVVLRDASGAAAGTLVVSPSAGRIVVTASGLAAPAAGAEYRCWVEVGGTRTALGTMTVAGDVGWWSGRVSVPAQLPSGIVYGVSLVERGAAGPGTKVLTGEL